jgi:hypothetical protein
MNDGISFTIAVLFVLLSLLAVMAAGPIITTGSW